MFIPPTVTEPLPGTAPTDGTDKTLTFEERTLMWGRWVSRMGCPGSKPSLAILPTCQLPLGLSLFLHMTKVNLSSHLMGLTPTHRPVATQAGEPAWCWGLCSASPYHRYHRQESQRWQRESVISCRALGPLPRHPPRAVYIISPYSTLCPHTSSPALTSCT